MENIAPMPFTSGFKPIGSTTMETDTLGARIKRAIKDAGITQADLARIMSVNPQAVSGWIRNNRISKTRMAELAGVLKVDIGWLIKGGELVRVAEPAEPEPPLVDWTDTKARTMRYRLKVETDAVADRIPPGSIIVVNPSIEPVPGNIVVASVCGALPVLREFRRDGGNVVLKAHNRDYSMIAAPPGDVAFHGVVESVSISLLNS